LERPLLFGGDLGSILGGAHDYQPLAEALAAKGFALLLPGLRTASDFGTNGVVGNATEKAKSILNAAKGSVLLIDEAYNLNPPRDPSGGSTTSASGR
jgi:hypothetical protein